MMGFSITVVNVLTSKNKIKIKNSSQSSIKKKLICFVFVAE